jgi:hypothetical protein
VARPSLRLALPLAVLLAGALPRPGQAQDAAPPPAEDPRAPKYADVERGFFVGFETGWLGFQKTPTQDPAKFPYAPADGGASSGMVIALNVGYDVTQRLALSLFAEAASQQAGASYGAFDVLAAGLDARFAFYGKKDRNGWDRLFLWVHARGGYLVSHPSGLFADTDILLAAGLGVEYYTQLRHFSVGLQVDGIYAVTAAAPGVSVAPFVRYTF